MGRKKCAVAVKWEGSLAGGRREKFPIKLCRRLRRRVAALAVYVAPIHNGGIAFLFNIVPARSLAHRHPPPPPKSLPFPPFSPPFLEAEEGTKKLNRAFLPTAALARLKYSQRRARGLGLRILLLAPASLPLSLSLTIAVSVVNFEK